MNIEVHDAAEIQVVAMEDSLQEPVVQRVLATEVAAEAVQAPTEQHHAAPNRWTTVWQALSHGQCVQLTATGWGLSDLLIFCLFDHSAAWDVADEHLANLFGLNESKYEWAVREYYWQKRQEEEEQAETPQSSRPQVQSAFWHVCSD